MSAWVWIALAVVALAALAIAGWVVFARGRRRGLQHQFGPEYDRTVERTGDRHAAEADLLERRDRYADLDIRPLEPEVGERYADEWRRVQAGFVDEPERSFLKADRLVTAVMRDRGYPMETFEVRVDDVSVEHPHVVEHFRAAHEVALEAERGRAGTEDLRQGMVHYRALFEDLLQDRRTEVG
jgi:hypothetical protein